jgi:hypothetical protein
MSYIVTVSNKDYPTVGAVQITTSPETLLPMSFDEARDVAEACLFAAGVNYGKQAGRRARNMIRKAEPGTRVELGPVVVIITSNILVQ